MKQEEVLQVLKLILKGASVVAKQIRIFRGMSRGERALQGDWHSTFRGVQTSLKPLSGVQRIGSEIEHLKKRLKKRKINHKLIWAKFIDQEILLKCAESKRKRSEKEGAKIIAQACKAAFFMDFEKCKSIAQLHLPPNFVKYF